MNLELEKSAIKLIFKAKKIAGSNIIISDSGGIDSTVIRHIAGRCGITEGVFFNTGVETKENVKFLKTLQNVTWYTPKQSFKEFCFEKGFPIGGKETLKGLMELKSALANPSESNFAVRWKRLMGNNYLGNNSTKAQSRFALPMWCYESLLDKVPLSSQCCNVLKKNIRDEINRFSITGEMIEESMLRKTSIENTGALGKNKVTPLYNWTKEDVWAYVKKYNLKYSKAYDMGALRTGCIQCDTSIWFRVKRKEEFMSFEKKYYPKQRKASLKLKHKDGYTFEQAVAKVEGYLLNPIRSRAYSEKLRLVEQLDGELRASQVKYNRLIILETKIDLKRLIAKYTKVELGREKAKL